MSWRNCVFDGTTTTCTLSGQYTGLGPGGTYSVVVSHAGNGAFPLITVSTLQDPNFFTARAIGALDFHITLTPTSGPAINFYSFANFSFLNTAAAVCTGLPAGSACAAGAVRLTPGATMSGPITLTFVPNPTITPGSLITAGAFGAAPAATPGSWLEIYGFNLATVRQQTWATADFNGNTAPSSLGGTQVTIGGKSAFIDYVSPSQVNVQVPSDVPLGIQPLVMTTAGGSSTIYNLTVNATQPGMLAPPSFVMNGTQHVVALISNTFTYVLPVTLTGATTVRAKAGDSITLFGVGFGGVTPVISAGQIVGQNNQLQAAFQVTFAGVPRNVTYAGLAPGYVGLYQFNVTVPTVAAGDAVPLVVRLGGTAVGQTLAITIR